MSYEIKVKDSRVDGEKLKQFVEVYADTESDIPDVRDNWASGSYVFILDTQEVKFLNSQGEWV